MPLRQLFLGTLAKCTHSQWHMPNTFENGCRLMGNNQAILPSQTIREYIKKGHISTSTPIEESQIQPASIDLRLGSVAYELRSSFLPGELSDIVTKLETLQLCRRTLDLENSAVLEANKVYLIELTESLSLPPHVWARANPRSTTGRADMFTRLLCDFGTEFEGVPPGYTGKLYVEVVPRTFSVRVKQGTRLNQIRFISETWPHGIDLLEPEGKQNLHSLRKQILTVDLEPGDSAGIIGFRARRHAPVLDFDCVGCHDRQEFWDPLFLGELRSIVLAPDDFFLLKSTESVVINPREAAELSPYDPSFGEFRVHYAGFLDPGFGYEAKASVDQGTPVVLEVRTRDVCFLIEHAQRIAWLQYYQLHDLPDKIYGAGIGSSYHRQGITPGKQFT